MSQRKKTGGRQRKTATLKQHKRQGKTLSPPFMTLPVPTTPTPWLRDTFPDMIWLAMLITEYGTVGMRIAAEVLDRINNVIDDSSEPEQAGKPVLSGQLAAFEKVPQELRARALDAVRRDDLFERAVPWTFARALMKYSDVPGMWLLNGWQGNEQIVSADEPEKLLAKVIRDHSHGQSPSATRAKFMVLLAWAKGNMLHFAPGVGEGWLNILPRYPDNITDAERQLIEPNIRATFLALANPEFHGEDDNEPLSLTWAKNFWRSNWKLYSCAARTGDGDEVCDSESDQAMEQARAEWRARLDESSKKLRTVARQANPDLYSPDRHEVLTGIAHRALRDLYVLINYPALWTIEHGASYIRSLVEARIVLRWLIKKDDPMLYSRFKAYGRGRLKLFKLHLEDYRDSLDSPAPELDSHIEHLEVLVNQSTWEEFQEIQLDGNFAGVDTRKMAEQTGMLTEYRLVFAPASSNVHGEWTALDQYALAACMNPLHRDHRIPREDLSILLNPELVESALGHASALVADYVHIWSQDATPLRPHA